MSGPKVPIGLELIEKESLERLGRIGLLCHPASVDARLRHAENVLVGMGARLTALFGPQHGYLGQTQDNMIEWEGFLHPKLGVPVYSLYGEARKPTPAMLENLDSLVIDLQDVGTRVYTFVYTMALCMRACAEAGKKAVVLDRPNPIGGEAVEGNALDPEWTSFVGLYPIPMRHGLTIAEMAKLFNEAFGIRCDLEIVPMKGWRRGDWFDGLDRPWVLPSPNMPTLDTAAVYPGTVLFEGLEISEGRGLTRPFEIVGAPWVDPDRLVRRLSELPLPGAAFRPAWFQPTFHKFAGQVCGGVQIHVTDRRRFLPFRTGVALVMEIRRQDPERFRWKQPPYEYVHDRLPFDVINGTDAVRRFIEEDADLLDMEASWTKKLDEFLELRESFLLYK